MFSNIGIWFSVKTSSETAFFCFASSALFCLFFDKFK